MVHLRRSVSSTATEHLRQLPESTVIRKESSCLSCSDELASEPLYFGDQSQCGSVRGETRHGADCRNVYVAEQHGGCLRLTQRPDQIAYDFIWFHGAYARIATTPPAWAYQEKNVDHPELSVQTEVKRVVTVPDQGVPNWQVLLPKGIFLMATDGRIGYGLPDANGVPPDVRFEKQSQFHALRKASGSQTVQRNVLLGGLIVGVLVAGIFVAWTAAKARRVR